jgi:threonylcarbamoyladenosine tRNA methylthiotransferase MtaB
MDVYVGTLGCRLNQAESDALEQMAQHKGYRITDDPTKARLHIVNTCSITHQGDADSRKLIRRLHRSNPDAAIVVTGCYATHAPQEVSALEGVRRVVGNGAKHRLFDGLGDEVAKSESVPDILWDELNQNAKKLRQLSTALNPRRTRAYLKIQDGCDYRCSFCIVPSVRGASRSVASEVLISEVQALTRAGQKEICLTGVHLGTYGRDLSPRLDLLDLLRLLLPHLGGARLRLGSLDPHEVSDEFIDFLRQHQDKICRHLHLPLQSAHNGTLQRMRRAHTVEHFIHVVERSRTLMPELAIGSDIIGGFPGESDADFESGLHVLQDLPLSYLHVFPYSIRQETAAATFEKHVDASRKQERCRRLRQFSDEKGKRFRRELVGKTIPAIVLQGAPDAQGKLNAISDNYVKVKLVGDDTLKRRWLDVRVQASKRAHVQAHIV